jgi:hypothetical protein
MNEISGGPGGAATKAAAKDKLGFAAVADSHSLARELQNEPNLVGNGGRLK